MALQKLATYWRNKFLAPVVGITGSVGKTSTKELVYSVLSQKYNTLKNQGNFNNEIGLPLTLLNLNRSHQQIVLEMGMYDLGEIKTLCEIAKPQIGLITNIGPSHLERLGTIKRIVMAKQELVEALPKNGTAILNRDDPRVYAMRHQTKANVITYGLSKQANLWANEIKTEDLSGIRFTLHYQNQAKALKTPLLGQHNVLTALAAAAVGFMQGLTWSQIETGLQDEGAKIRLIPIPAFNGCTVLDDTYNASPASTIAALNVLQQAPAKRKIAVLGDMAELGHYETEAHQKVGRWAAKTVDILITVGPKSHLTAAEAIACGLNKKATKLMNDANAALNYLKTIVRQGDLILVKGSRSTALEIIVTGLTALAKNKI